MSTPAAPTPTPSPFAGPGSYQWQFNAAYYAYKAPGFQPLYAGRPGSTQPNTVTITQAAAWALVAQLIAAGAIVDEEIDAEGMDPFTTMFMRQLYGNTWEPAGLGNTQSTEVITPGEYSGPVPAGAIKVSTNIADFPPYPVPPAPTLSTTTTKAANPVGQRITFNSAIGLMDLFRCAVPDDGYPTDGTGTWTGTAGGFTGTWTKVAVELGLMTVWQLTSI